MITPDQARASLWHSAVRRFGAILFDLDGVLTETATMHRAAWKSMFDEFLLDRARECDQPFVPFGENDYFDFVDGKPRLAGVSGFLESRGIRLPEGDAEEQPPAMTVAGLGDRKNELFSAMLDSGGVTLLPGARRFVQLTRQRGLRAALVSSSANASRVLSAAGLGNDFDAQVDGLVARQFGLAGKPAPDTFLEAARLVGTEPARSVVIEDALVGVAAGRAGRFGLVVGIGSPDQAAALHDHGADVVVSGLSELLPD